MSNPTELQTPGVPDWMQEETNNPSTSNYDLERPAPAATSTVTPVEIVPADNSTKESAYDAAAKKTWGQYFAESFRRDGRLLLITLLILICMNIPFVKWGLYPFTIFSTWIHELCHGMAAVIAGGKIDKLLVFPDGSGLAYTAIPGNRQGFVASAGYQGTAVIGCLLLIFRRTKRGPRTGTMVVAIMMMLSVLLWIRNVFGALFLFFMGLLLAIAAWKLPSTHMRNLYIGLAVTCSLNAITSVQNLFGSSHQVNGEPTTTDAHSMADIKGGSAVMWALVWLMLAIFLTVAGILFAIPGPDEVADFTCCGVCQDLGCFRVFNYPGQRLLRRLRGSTSTTNATTTSGASPNTGESNGP